jgi:tetratricopeptide (TPR) repeat protein
MMHAAKCFALALGVFVLLSGPAHAQQPSSTPQTNKGEAYYNFAMGHLYAELAAAYGNRGEYLNKAIEHYKLALKHDPNSALLFEELAELYIQAGKVRDAVTEAEDLLRQNPSNMVARRILGRIYTRMIGDVQQGRVDENMLRLATEQYIKIAEADPKDIDAFLTLGRLYRVARNSLEAEKAYKKAVELDANNEEALTGLAILYSDLGDTKRAIEMLSLVTARNPSPRTLVALASSYEQMRDFASAADVLKKALELAPDNLRIKSGLAQNLLFAGRYDDALKLYLELAKQDPKDVQTHLRIAEIYRQRREFVRAHAALSKAKELDRDSIEVRFDEVNLLESEGKNEQAIVLLKSILDDTAKKSYSVSERNNRAMLLERLGVLHRNVSQYAQAVEVFRQIAALHSEFAPRVAVQVVDTWRLAKDYSKAQQEMDAALKQFPNERVLKMSHASLLADLGKVDEAAAVVRSTQTAENERETLLALSQVYDRGKRFAEMEKTLASALDLSKSEDEREAVHFLRGAMYEKMKRYDQAEAEFREVLRKDPNNASALNYLGYMFADRGVRLEEAHQLISKALELDPNNGAYLDSLGWVYYRQDKLQEAETYLERSLEFIKNDPTVHDHLGDVYFKQGRIKDAINQWQASLKQWEANPPADLDPAEVAKITRKLENARVRLARESSSQQP